VVVVRKQIGQAHSSRKVEGKIRGRYVIIDDFIDTGSTIRHIVEDLKTSGVGDNGECVGLYLYEDRWLYCNDPANQKTETGAEFVKEQRERFAKDAGMRILNWADRQVLLDEIT